MQVVPTNYFNLYDYFLSPDRLESIGHRTAIEFRDRLFTYNDLRAEVTYWANELIARGISPGDRVALLLYDSPEFVAAFLGVSSIGAITIPISTFLPAESVAYILRDCGARLVIAERDLQDRLLQAPASDEVGPGGVDKISIDLDNRPCLRSKTVAERRLAAPATTADSPAFILYTSGSTGEPKGVLHRQGAIPATVETYARSVLQLTDRDRTYSASRMFFAYGLGDSVSFPLAAGATTILHTDRAAPEQVADTLERYRPTVFFGVPALYRSLLDLKSEGRALNTANLRLCVSAGEALPGKIFDDWKRETGLTILDGIGSTEMLHIFLSNRPDDAHPDSSGGVVNGYEARLLDDAGSTLEGEATGNLWVRGESHFAEYWGKPHLTREVIRDGWVRTGDVYHRTTEGRFHHIGRTDDCFKVKGLWVSPVEVEAALLSHESVVEAAVVADYDETGLATGHAFVVIRQDVDRVGLDGVLREHLRSRLAHHKVPSTIDFLHELPRTATGKVQRFKLRRDGRV